MKYIFFIFVSIFLLSSSCKKRKEVQFTLNSLTLKSFDHEEYPQQKVYLKVLETGSSSDKSLYVTDNYSTEYTLPAKFSIEPKLKMDLYKKDYVVELWGELSGFIGRNEIHIEDYKIIYPLEMETENNNLIIAIAGTWK